VYWAVDQHGQVIDVFDVLQDVRGRVLLDQPLTRRRRWLDRLLGGARRAAEALPFLVVKLRTAVVAPKSSRS
jgi:hypothetical protein